uniref:WW domain-containing protein n=1 Tax=Arion vulgaris TaxID=1028688 RepID=A0A0B6ZP42_9EUPU
MSEYWKSVPRKFCEFCKCWITDNKPSVDFHERGKRHKENVELKLKEVRKKSLQNSIDEAERNADMEKMEKAALEAFKKDLKENPDLAAKYGVSLEPKPQPKTEADVSSSVSLSVSSGQSAASPEVVGDSVKEWYEAVAPEGYHYYWSTVTGESKWEPPDEFVSLDDQETNQDKKDTDTSPVNQASIEPCMIALPEDEPPSSKTREDPSNSRSAYGAWDVVKEIEQPVIYYEGSMPPALDDIPLPSDSQGEETSVKTQTPKFKERTVTSLSSSSDVIIGFKKRKISSGARNIRQKDTND